MRKQWFYIPIFVFFVMILVGCTSLFNKLPTEVSDLSTLKNTDQLYILTVFVDKDVEDLINDLAGTLTDALTNLFKPAETGSATDTFYNIYDVYDKHPVAVQKLRNMLGSSNSLTSMIDLEIPITGQAKMDILAALNPEETPTSVQKLLLKLQILGNSVSGMNKTLEKFITSTPKLETSLNGVKIFAQAANKFKYIMQTVEEPANLVVDYRDIMYLRGVVNLLLSVYDSKESTDYNLGKMNEINSAEDPLKYFLTDDAYTKISTFMGKYTGEEPPLTTEAFWRDLDTLIKDLAGTSQNLIMKSLFNPNVLSFKGFKFLIDEADFYVDIVNKVYDFEIAKTDSNGWTNNSKTSLYEYMKMASEDENISIKTGLDETINPPEMESGTTMTELKFGAVDMLKNPKYIDLVKELDKDLPTGNLTVSTKLQIRPTQESTETIPTDVSLSISLNFSELRNEPFDLLNNNIGIKTKMISELINMNPPIWEVLAEESTTPEEVSQILNIVYSNLTFYDSASKTLTVTIDNGVTIKASIIVPEG